MSTLAARIETPGIGGQTAWLLRMAAVAMVGLIGLVDYATGWELSLFVFYAMPIFFLVWRRRRNDALVLSLICTVVWWAANHSSHPYQTWWGFPSAAASRLVFFISIVIGGAALRANRDADRARIAALERANELEREILRVSEREQRRIGQDLHDGLCQHLAALGCAARSLADDLSARSAPESADAREIEDLLKESVVQARDLAAGIFPVRMGALGLSAALQALAATTAKLASVKISFAEEGDPQVENSEAAMHLFRIAQEAMNNAMRHGKARNIRIRLRDEEEGRVTLTIEDDGKGLAPGANLEDGMGLRTMRYRARLLGSELQLNLLPAAGFRVTCTIRRDAKPSAANIP